MLWVDENELPSQLPGHDTNEIVAQLFRCKRFYCAVAVEVILLALVIGGLFSTFVGWSVKSSLSAQIRENHNQMAGAFTTMSNQIIAEMGTDRVRTVIVEVASAQARDILSNQIAPVVESFKLETAKKLQVIESIQARTRTIEDDVRAATQLAQPAFLIPLGTNVSRLGDRYFVRISFELSQNRALAEVRFSAQLDRDTASKIVQFIGMGIMTDSRQRISPDGKAATVSYAPGGPVALFAELSGPATVTIGGDQLRGPIVLEARP